MKYLVIEDCVKDMLRNRTYGPPSGEIPEWLLKYRETVKGTLYYYRMEGRTELLPADTVILDGDVTYEELGLVSSMNCGIVITQQKSRIYYEDGKMENRTSTSLVLLPNHIRYVSNASGKTVPVQQDCYALFNDGKDALLLFCHQALPKREYRKRNDMLFQ